MNKEKIRAEAGDSGSVKERSADSMAESVENLRQGPNLLQGIRNSVRRLIRNVALVTQVSAAALGAVGCSTSPATEELQCVSENPSLEPDDTPQCDSTIPAEPQVKEVAVFALCAGMRLMS